MDWKSALTQVNSVKLLGPLSVYSQKGHILHALHHRAFLSVSASECCLCTRCRGREKENKSGLGGSLFPFSIVISVFTECGSSAV